MGNVYLNIRVLAYPEPNKPVTIASVQSLNIPIDKIDSAAVDLAVKEALEILRTKVKEQPNLETLSHEQVSSAHLHLLANEIQNKKIENAHVCLMAHPKEGIVIQIHLR